ncbi:MAG: GTP 3',8-cyclase MoaA [Bacteroidota bacterium]
MSAAVAETATDLPTGARRLTDRFGRRHTYLRLSLTERCNLRCRYCMPAAGVPLTPRGHLLTTPEILRLARLFVGMGVEKVRLTGGEPLVRKDAEAVAEALGAMPGLRTLALTTNGLLLHRKLDRLYQAGLTHINLSLDTLRADRFAYLARRSGLDAVLDALDLALGYGYTGERLKVNVVVMRGINDDELADFVALTEERPVEVRFIEYMPFDGNGWASDRLVPYAEMLARIEARFPLERRADGPHETARTYRVPGHAGRVGVVASMTAPFCAGCNRLRLTADGALKVCLFGQAEVSLRDALRAGASDEALRATVHAAVQRKKAAHGGIDEVAHAARRAGNRPMILIGG